MRNLLIFLFLSIFSAPAWGYGQEGHEAICQVAYNELNQKAKAEVDRLIALETDPADKAFHVGCRWPDRYSQFPDDLSHRGNDHYINLPRSMSVVSAEACFNAKGSRVQQCLFSAIRHDSSVLSDTNTSDEQKLKALKFLGHWIGDLHQPLHVSFGDDRGGNDVDADQSGCRDKLHSVLDTCIPKDMMQEAGFTLDRSNRDDFGNVLHAEITQAERQVWLGNDMVGWADESFQEAMQPDLEYCVQVGGKCQYSATKLAYKKNDPKRLVNADSAYEDKHSPMIRERMKQAGVRLGAMLNTLLGS